MNKYTKKYLYSLILLAAPLAFAKPAVDAQKDVNRPIKNSTFNAENSNYSPYVQIDGTKFFKPGNTNAATFNFFLPLWEKNSNNLVFSHIRVYNRTDSPFEGNIHFGYRYLLPDSKTLYGVYTSLDRQRTKFGNDFNQIILGVESWFNHLFIGGNFYQPIGNTNKLIETLNPKINPSNSKRNVWTNNHYEKAMGGVDLEIGYEFTRYLTGYIGGYYFSANNVPTIAGPKARLNYEISNSSGKKILGIVDNFGLEMGIQKDKARGIRWYLSLICKMGLTNKNSKLEEVAKHMTDLVRRDVDIISTDYITTTLFIAPTGYTKFLDGSKKNLKIVLPKINHKKINEKHKQETDLDETKNSTRLDSNTSGKNETVDVQPAGWIKEKDFNSDKKNNSTALVVVAAADIVLSPLVVVSEILLI